MARSTTRRRKKNFRLPIWRSRSICLLFCSSWQPGVSPIIYW
jgi:Nicotinamide mononucleotide transporter